MGTPLTRIASLDLIRGLVAVGRRMSITLAADDLCLTQSAVSRQIHALEETLGVALFTRGYRSISFTPAGERLFHAADSALRQLQDALESVGGPSERQPVTITASIGVAALWLLPRLGSLQKRHPALDVRVAANDKLLDLRAEGIDLGIRYAALDRAPAGATRLFGESIVPVAHPSLRVTRLDAETLGAQVLLEFDGPRRPLLRWSDHLSAMGLGDVQPRSILRFNQYDQVIQAALASQGIALGRAALVGPLVCEGRLVALGDGRAYSNGYAYWLCRAENDARQDVLDVATWIVSEALGFEPEEPALR
jgi:LysR family transcriptional regulator, glycine cleavage system transcriptional activator